MKKRIITIFVMSLLTISFAQKAGSKVLRSGIQTDYTHRYIQKRAIQSLPQSTRIFNISMINHHSRQAGIDIGFNL